VKVEDEWDRNPDIETTDDRLYVSFDAEKVTVEKLLECIKREGFEGKIASGSE
jgi:hypothetical protein